jgi:hypothetical protein
MTQACICQCDDVDAAIRLRFFEGPVTCSNAVFPVLALVRRRNSNPIGGRIDARSALVVWGPSGQNGTRTQRLQGGRTNAESPANRIAR